MKATHTTTCWVGCSPFGGIPRNWKHYFLRQSIQASLPKVPPSGGSLEIGNFKYRVTGPNTTTLPASSPFGGIPRNWKPAWGLEDHALMEAVPPSGGSLEIGNHFAIAILSNRFVIGVPPSGGSLEIGNL